MTKKPITEINLTALKEVENYIEFSDRDKEPILKKITYCAFQSMTNDLQSILNAIEFIGYNGNETDLATCANLASIANKLVPSNEMEFLDELLIKNTLRHRNPNFKKIETL